MQKKPLNRTAVPLLLFFALVFSCFPSPLKLLSFTRQATGVAAIMPLDGRDKNRHKM
jgi:hypothetical protein